MIYKVHQVFIDTFERLYQGRRLVLRRDLGTIGRSHPGSFGQKLLGSHGDSAELVTSYELLLFFFLFFESEQIWQINVQEIINQNLIKINQNQSAVIS